MIADPAMAVATVLDCAILSDRLGYEVSSATVIRHKPGRRLLIRYETASGPLLGKIRANHRASTPFKLQSKFFEQGFGNDTSDQISVPEPVALLDDLGMWLQRLVPGTAATHLFITASPAERIWTARQSARAAHKVHTTSIAARRTHTIDDELRILDHRLADVQTTHAQLAARVDKVRLGCRALAEHLGVRPISGIHRDFYPDQLVVDRPQISIVDFDLYCDGDPAVDIGNFLAHLTELALRTLDDPHGLDDCRQTFLAEYLALAGEQNHAAVQVYETLSLARHISLSTEFQDRQAFTEPLLALIEQRLARC
jgi:aminoglycoside phosphotransferase (APT) family kinase protein